MAFTIQPQPWGVVLMMYDYFYCDYLNNAEVESGDPVSVEIEEILRAMNTILRHKENFLGIVDEDGTCIQFAANDDGSVDIDFPVPEKGGSYAKSTTLEECLGIVAKLDGAITREGIAGLEWSAWRAADLPPATKPWWKFW